MSKKSKKGGTRVDLSTGEVTEAPKSGVVVAFSPEMEELINGDEDIAIDSKASLAAMTVIKEPRVTPPKTEVKAVTKNSNAKWPKDYIIRILKFANPKRKYSAAFDRYELYVDGMSIAEALTAGLLRIDFDWDLDHGFIRINPPRKPVEEVTEEVVAEVTEEVTEQVRTEVVAEVTA